MSLPEPIVIPIETLTPIWTGDANRKTSYIKGSSLIGGLRFWTEALVRSLGGRVCDITDSGGKDIYDPENKNDICRVCEIFGCTGKGRGFSLKIRGQGRMEPEPIGTIVLTGYQYQKFNHRSKKMKTETPTWYLNDAGLSGSFKIELLPLVREPIQPELALALILMLTWGTLGARDQYGFGLVKPTFPKKIISLARTAVPEENGNPHNGLSLRDFFYFNAETGRERRTLPFEIRYLVRRSLENNQPLRHYFGGSISNRDKCATKYNIGMAEGRIRGWGFFPREGPFSEHRDRCLNNLKNTILEKCDEDSLSWREFNSNRDTDGRHNHWPQFLNEFFEGGVS